MTTGGYRSKLTNTASKDSKLKHLFHVFYIVRHILFDLIDHQLGRIGWFRYRRLYHQTGELMMNTIISRHLLAFLAIAIVAGCSSHSPPRDLSAAMNTMAQKDPNCLYKGNSYSEGGISCQSNMQFRCGNGAWIPLNLSCGNSPIAAAKSCLSNGISFSTGSTSCQNDALFRCEDGVWQDLSTSCSMGNSPIRPASGSRTCMFGDATVASNSTICRSGSTFLCSDGEWMNLGWLCH